MVSETKDIKKVINEDETIIQIIKEIFNDNLEFEHITTIIKQNINRDLVELGKSIVHIKNNHRDAYIENKHYLDIVQNIIDDHVKLNELWMQISLDKNILKPVSRMIALWLASDFTEEETEQYYNDISKEINNSNINDLINTVNRIKNVYPDIYDFKNEYFEEIIDTRINVNTEGEVSASLDSSNNYEKDEENIDLGIKSKFLNIFKRK